MATQDVTVTKKPYQKQTIREDLYDRYESDFSDKDGAYKVIVYVNKSTSFVPVKATLNTSA